MGKRSAKPRIILASASPRRRELLERTGLVFEVIESGAPEFPRHAEAPAAYATRLAEDKALAVSSRNPGAIVIGADTIVVLGDEILEKPASAEDARAMLKRLSNNVHIVITAVAIARGGVVVESTPVESRVTFRALSDLEIDEYVATPEPYDKAGAYGIQGVGGSFISNVEGGRDTVMGLPTERVLEALERWR